MMWCGTLYHVVSAFASQAEPHPLLCLHQPKAAGARVGFRPSNQSLTQLEDGRVGVELALHLAHARVGRRDRVHRGCERLILLGDLGAQRLGDGLELADAPLLCLLCWVVVCFQCVCATSGS